MAVLAVLSAMIAAEVAAAGGQPSPPGNNGTVKIDGIEFDQHNNNEPHPGCLFEIEFYGYDEGDLEATYEIEMWPPTAGPVVASGTVDIGEDPAGGGTDLDGAVLLDISAELLASGVDPHPIQGWHVRLTVNAEGSQGADVKHKTFWVLCEDEPEPTPSPTVSPTETATPTPTPTTSVLPTIFTEPPEPTVAGSTVQRPRLAKTASATSLAWMLGAWFITFGWLLQSIQRPERNDLDR